MMLRVLLAFAVTAMVLVAGAASAASGCRTPENVNQLATELAAGINANRRANGQAPLAYDQRLGRAAMAHACDMAQRSFFGHAGSDGSNVQARARRAGFRDCIIAENLAWGYPASQQIVSGWMNSAGHRRNMLHPRLAQFGVGISEGPKGPNWVLVLGKSC